MSQKFLIVEDQQALAKAMADLLARYGIDCDISGDGIDALKRYSASSYDLLIMDLHLPGLAGPEVTRKIRSTHRGKTQPIIITTGVYKGGEYAKKAREVFGVKHYLEKPFKQEDFLRAIKDSISAGKEKPAQAQPKEQEKAEMPVSKKPVPKKQTDEPSVKIEPVAVKQQTHSSKQVAEIRPTQAMQGNFSVKPMGSLLVDAMHKRINGVLFAKKGDEEKRVLFAGGMPVSLATNKPDNSFGNYLFCKGKISLMEYQVYQSNLEEGKRADELFIKMGCLLPADYYNEWRVFMENTLIRMIGWEEGEFTMQLQPSFPETAPVPHINVAHVLHQGFKQSAPAERVEAVRKKAAGRFLSLRPAYYDHQMHLDIDTAEALFLDGIDGVTRFEDLLPRDPGEMDKVLRAFGAFLALGMIELHTGPIEDGIEAPFPIRDREIGKAVVEEAEEEEPEEESAPSVTVQEAEGKSEGEGFDDLLDDLEDTLGDIDERAAEAPTSAQVQDTSDRAQQEKELLEFYDKARGKNYYELFDMKIDDFSITKCKDRYFKLTKQFSPENFIMSSGEHLSKAEEVLSLLATAYNTLSNVVSKEKYDDMVLSSSRAKGVPGAKDHDKMQAEVAFQSGMAFLEMADWDGAEKSLAEAMSYAPDNADIIAQYAYAIYNKNRKSIAVHKRVHDLLSQALKLKPKCAAAFAYRGALLLDEDKVQLAEADFKKALSINPRYRFALKGIKKIELKKQDEKKGLFGRFKK